MKQLATLFCIGIFGCVQAQTTSREVEIVERYENGNLVEQRQSATENGVPIENFDFESAKREMQLKSGDMEQKMEQMRIQSEQRMNEMMKQMDQKMQDFERRSNEMQRSMDQRMNEIKSRDSEQPINR